jgi:hypothetical protein
MPFIFNNKTKTVDHGKSKFSPIVCIVSVTLPNRICPLKNFVVSTGSKKLAVFNDVTPNVLDRVEICPLSRPGKNI